MLDAVTIPAQRNYQVRKLRRNENSDVNAIYDIVLKERQQLDLKSVDEFFNPVVSEGSDFDLQDAEAGTAHLKRVFNLMYRKK